ncbi:MAG: hypothetical protein CMK59_10150 [Proteobacteria bacterium]|nr:hypothetical protein [Pseudomonadota bacterium]
MNDEQRRKAIIAKLNQANGDHLRKISAFIDDMFEAEKDDIARAQLIRTLPTIITDYPILIWGWDPCDSNEIHSVWFGPTSAPMTGLRKGYPQFYSLDRDNDSALIVCVCEEFRLAGYDQQDLIKLAKAVDIDVEQLIDLERWACGRSRWPYWYDRTKNTTTPADLLTACSMDHFEDIQSEIINTIEGLDLVVSFLQEEIHRRGMVLWSEYPDVSFSFNRENGSIDLVNAQNLLPLLNRPTPEKTSTKGLTLLTVGVDLSNHDFSGATLSDLYLQEVNFTGANLSNADLSGTDLSHAVFDQTNLSGADLSGADLSGVDLTAASNIDGLQHDDSTIWPEGFSP